MNLIEAWKKAKIGGCLRRTHSKWGRTTLVKRDAKEWLVDIPLMASLTVESFLADDWEIEKRKRHAISHVFTSLNTEPRMVYPRMVYIPSQIPFNTSIKITWEWEE